MAFPSALPLIEVDSKEDAESLEVLFGSLIQGGLRAGVHVVDSLARLTRDGAGETECIDELMRVREQFHEQYERMKARRSGKA